MKCNVKDCYWNMWLPKYELFKDESCFTCVSELLDEHYDEDNDFKMTPNSVKCQGYLSYTEFCGVSKESYIKED